MNSEFTILVEIDMMWLTPSIVTPRNAILSRQGKVADHFCVADHFRATREVASLKRVVTFEFVIVPTPRTILTNDPISSLLQVACFYLGSSVCLIAQRSLITAMNRPRQDILHMPDR